MPLPFGFEGKGVLEFVTDSSSSSFSLLSPFSNPLLNQWKSKEGALLGSEPTSVLDSIGSPSPQTSTSTLSSSLPGGGGGGGVAAVSGNPSQKWPPPQETTSSNVGVESELQPVPPPPQTTTAIAATEAEKCALGMGMEDWESQEQSIFRWIMGDVEDPSMGLNKLLQSAAVSGGAPAAELEFTGGGFGVVDQGFGLDPVGSSLPNPPIFSPLSNNLLPISLSPIAFNNPPQQCQQPLEPTDSKPQIFNPPFLINHHQSHHTQNPSFFLPEHHLAPPPQAKRHHHSGLEPPKGPFSNHQLQLLPQYVQQRPTISMKQRIVVGDEMGMNQQQQQTIIDLISEAAELIQTGNSILAQEILARLNHQLSPIGKPFNRAAFFCKEALQFILHTSNMNPVPPNSPFNLILKIGAYKSFSEISPFIQFAHFTSNQALLEVLEGFDRIHVIDFDIGYGGQWASLMQELALRSNGAPSLKITAFASPSTHDQLELGLTRENLIHFAGENNMAFEFEIVNIDSLNSASWSLPFHVSDNEAVAVNLPVGSLSNYQMSLPLILSFIKQLSPKIVVSVDRGCDRTDLPFPNHVIQALQSLSILLESLDAVNVNPDALQKIERFFLQPSIEKTLMGRYRSPEKTPHWRTLFLSCGFSPLTFSNFAESQAECVVKRTPVRGFHVEKRQSSLVLCWQRKDLISASAWMC